MLTGERETFIFEVLRGEKTGLLRSKSRAK